MPFGQYKNRDLSDIAEEDPEYLEWVLDNLLQIDQELRSAIEEALS